MQETTQPGPGGAPVCALDPFADGFLHDPFSFHNELREAGPVVWLEHYGMWGMARYAEVHEALRDCERYSSAAGPASPPGALARLEGEVLLQALARRAGSLARPASRAAASTTPSAASPRCR